MNQVSSYENREVIFWNIDSYAEDILRALNPYLSMHGISGLFHYYSSYRLEGLNMSGKYLLFYCFEDKKAEEIARRWLNDKKIDIRFVALCQNYQQGMDAIGKDNDYAIQLPLKSESVVKCYEHCCKYPMN